MNETIETTIQSDQSQPQPTLEELISFRSAEHEKIKKYSLELKKAQQQVTYFQFRLLEAKKEYEIIDRKIWEIKLAQEKAIHKPVKAQKSLLEKKLDGILAQLSQSELEAYLAKFQNN